MSHEERPLWSPREELMRLSLQVAVPLEIARLQAQGGPNDFQWEWAREFADELGSGGDILNARSGERKGETATIFNSFAYALAILAFVPGGITFAGLHFEATIPQP